MPLLYDYFREWYPERETQQFDCNEMNYFKKQCKTIVLVKSNSAFGVTHTDRARTGYSISIDE